MEKIIADDIAAVCRTAAEWSLSRIVRAIKERNHALIALPGGSSIKPFAGALVSALDSRTDLPRKRISILLADERMLPLEHDQRNDQLIAEVLRDAGATVERGPYRSPENRREGAILICEPLVGAGGATAEAAAGGYSEQLALAGGTVDLAVLGAGDDGHIASLFPNHALLERVGSGYAAITDSPKPPPTRITLLPESITGARAAVVLFFGEGKREALGRFLSGKEQPGELPALLARSVEDRLIASDQIDLVGAG